MIGSVAFRTLTTKAGKHRSGFQKVLDEGLVLALGRVFEPCSNRKRLPGHGFVETDGDYSALVICKMMR